MLQARKTLIFRHSTFGLVFAAAAAALCVLLTLRIRSVRGKGRLAAESVAYHWALSQTALLRVLSLCLCYPFCALLFDFVIRLGALNCHNSRVSRSLSLSAVLSVCLWLCFVFSQKENKLENQQTVC